MIICLFVLFVSANFAQKQIEKQTKLKTSISKKVKNSESAKKKTRITQVNEANSVCQLPASVANVELSRTEVVLNCPASDKSCLNNKIIWGKNSCCRCWKYEVCLHCFCRQNYRWRRECRMGLVGCQTWKLHDYGRHQPTYFWRHTLGSSRKDNNKNHCCQRMI